MAAFAPPSTVTAAQLIKNLADNEFCKVNCNLVRRNTLYVKQTFSELQAKRALPSMGVASTSTLPTNEMGHLLIGKSLPLLLKRYRILELLSYGTFSQIFRAVDQFLNRPVAVKVMRIGYNELGQREFALLQLMARRTLRGRRYFATCLDAFLFEDHFCIVQELYDDTLYSLVRSRPQTEASSTNGRHQPQGDVPSLLIVKPVASNRSGVVPASSYRPDGYPPRVADVSATGTSSRAPINARGMRNLQHISLSLVSALLMLRNEGLLHADIKPENCFFRIPALESNSQATQDHKTVTPGASADRIPPALRLHINTIDVTEVDLRLGDLGNAIHLSEVPLYYSEFDIQSLPYRAPEVLLGLPFTASIDMWSLGVLLAELCLGETLFVASSREEMLRLITRKLGSLCPVRFSGGMFSHLLSDLGSGSLAPSSSGALDTPTRQVYAAQFSYPMHLKAVKRLLTKSLPTEAHAVISSDFLHFLSGLLMPDPKLRLSPQEALLHPFLSELVPIPHQCLLGGLYGSAEGGATGGGAGSGVRSAGGVGGQQSVKNRAAASATQLRKLVGNPVTPRLKRAHNNIGTSDTSDLGGSSAAAVGAFHSTTREHHDKASFGVNEHKAGDGTGTDARYTAKYADFAFVGNAHRVDGGNVSGHGAEIKKHGTFLSEGAPSKFARIL